MSTLDAQCLVIQFTGEQAAPNIWRHDRSVEITLVSRDNYFLMTPLLFEAGSGVLEPRHAVNLDGAGAAMPLVAGDLRPRQPELLAQDVRKARPHRRVEHVLAAVHGQPELAHIEVTATVSAI